MNILNPALHDTLRTLKLTGMLHPVQLQAKFRSDSERPVQPQRHRPVCVRLSLGQQSEGSAAGAPEQTACRRPARDPALPGHLSTLSASSTIIDKAGIRHTAHAANIPTEGRRWPLIGGLCGPMAPAHNDTGGKSPSAR